MPLVSVIIPTCNRSSLIGRSINSILQQNFQDFEIIISDDGSSDDTEDVIRTCGDDRIRYFHKKHGGIAGARNFGLSKCSGSYVVFFDDDDEMHEDFLKVMVRNLAENRPYGVAYCLYNNVFPDGSERIGFNPDRYFTGWLTKRFFGKTPIILPSATMFRSSVFDDNLYDEGLTCQEDLDLLLRISLKHQFLCVPQLLISRHITSGSLSQRKEAVYMSILVYERFYHKLGGEKVIPAKKAGKKISRLYKRFARENLRCGNRRAAISLYKKAIGYYPFDFRYYRGLLKALMRSKKNDKMPEWQMPGALPLYVMVKAMGKTAGLVNTKVGNGQTHIFCQ